MSNTLLSFVTWKTSRIPGAMPHILSRPLAVFNFRSKVISLPNAALERNSTPVKSSRIALRLSTSTSPKSSAPSYWIAASSRIFRSRNVTTETSPVLDTSMRLCVAIASSPGAPPRGEQRTLPVQAGRCHAPGQLPGRRACIRPSRPRRCRHPDGSVSGCPANLAEPPRLVPSPSKSRLRVFFPGYLPVGGPPFDLVPVLARELLEMGRLDRVRVVRGRETWEFHPGIPGLPGDHLLIRSLLFRLISPFSTEVSTIHVNHRHEASPQEVDVDPPR